MNHNIIGACIVLALAFTAMAPPQDKQQNKSEQQQKKRSKSNQGSDTLSNRRMHDYKTPTNPDTPPVRNRPVPVPDTGMNHMH